MAWDALDRSVRPTSSKTERVLVRPTCPWRSQGEPKSLGRIPYAADVMERDVAEAVSVIQAHHTENWRRRRGSHSPAFSGKPAPVHIEALMISRTSEVAVCCSRTLRDRASLPAPRRTGAHSSSRSQPERITVLRSPPTANCPTREEIHGHTQKNHFSVVSVCR